MLGKEKILEDLFMLEDLNKNLKYNAYTEQQKNEVKRKEDELTSIFAEMYVN